MVKKLGCFGVVGRLKKLRRPRRPQQGRLQNSAGVLVDSDARADTLSSYLQDVQWAVRPCNLIEGRAPLWDELVVECGPITSEEIKIVITKFKYRKAGGVDGILPEHLKALGSTPAGLSILVQLCDICWSCHNTPETWKISKVALLLIKGDPSDCGNYRPISLLCMGYKIIASVILRRLKQGGAENRIWNTQFGFKSKSGTFDALFLLRRVLDDVWAEKDGSAVFVALDWAKAFDCISPDGLLDALRRFGLPRPFLEFIKNIYGNRQFFVQDMGQQSKYRAQLHGISQGCPLSPFLFIMLMTVIMHDATNKLQNSFGDILKSPLSVHDLIYADDTLLIDNSSDSIQKYMESVISTGAEYGLEINWSKVDLLGVRCLPKVQNVNGICIQQKDSIQYLGALISANGCIQSALNRRIGMALADFKVLDIFWTHVVITKKDKYKIYVACIISKLLYGLQTSWLTKTQRSKLDGFQAKCVRKICGVQHSYWSRISNTEVLSYVGAVQLSKLLLEQQLLVFGKIFRRPPHDVLRQSVFEANSGVLQVHAKRRRRGRPKLSWAVEVQKVAMEVRIHNYLVQW